MLTIDPPVAPVLPSIENQIFPLIAGAQICRNRNIAVPSGVTTITPTIPTGCKLVCPELVIVSQSTSSDSVTLTLWHDSGGIFGHDPYIIRTNGILSAQFALRLTNMLVMVPGDYLEVQASLDGHSFGFRGYIIPPDVPLKAFLTSLELGDNTIYTCPTGKVAYLIGLGPELYAEPFGFAHIFYNRSGGTRLVTVYLVPPSGSPSSANILNQKNVANTGYGFMEIPYGIYMTAGETYVVNSNGSAGGGQFFTAWFWEEDA